MVRSLPGGANLNVTIYNTGALAAAVLQFVAAMILSAGLVPNAGPVRRKTWLMLGYGGAVLFTAVLVAASIAGFIPPFFIQGVGPTALRQQVLGSADVLFVFSFFMFIAAYLRTREEFLCWYAGGLGLTAISLTGFLIQHAVGGPVGWVGRCAQYLGGIYFLASLVAAERNAQLQGTSFDDVLTVSLSGAEEKFRAAFERLRAIVDTALDAIIVIDSTGRMQSVNPAASRIFGYAPAEMVGRNVSMLMDEPHRSAHDSYIRRFLETGEARMIGIGNEVEARRKDGTCFPAELEVVVWRLDGKRYFTGILRDISERKRREEHVKLLLNEVNHRSKNMLSVVQAVAQRTIASDRGDFIERFSERLQALAANQDLLVKNGWRGVDIAELVRSQLAHFGDLVGSRITLEGPPLRVAATAAQAIGMALHELATNAGKYGALSNAQGEVSISWTIDPEGAGERRFSLSWTERGGPQVHPPARTGFGTEIIRDLPAGQLAAEVALDYSSGGLSWRMTCRPDKLLDDAGGEAQAREPA